MTYVFVANIFPENSKDFVSDDCATEKNCPIWTVKFKKDEPTLEQAQKYLDGSVDMLALTDGDIMLINDEGKYKFPRNKEATRIWLEALNKTDRICIEGDYIPGPVIIIKKKARKIWN